MFDDYSLYLVTGEETSRGRSTSEVVKSALAGGVDVVQMREKGLSKADLVLLGKQLAGLCAEKNAVFIVNDDPFIARETGSCGVHLGQEDIKKFRINETRRLLGKEKIIGVSTHSFNQFKDANDSDADYIAFGPIFPTKTKDYFIGMSEVGDIMRIATKPVVLIGGINPDNMEPLLEAGGRNIAVIRAVTQAEDIEKTVRSFKNSIDAHKKVF